MTPRPHSGGWGEREEEKAISQAALLGLSVGVYGFLGSLFKI